MTMRGLCVTLGLALGYLELLRWVRSSFWCVPASWGTYAVFGAAFICYAAGLMVVAHVCARLLTMVRRQPAGPVASALAPGMAALAAWTVLASSRGDGLGSMDGLFAVVLLAVCGSGYLAFTGHLAARTFSAVWWSVFLGGGWLLSIGSYLFLVFAPPSARINGATLISLGWMGASGFVGLFIVARRCGHKVWDRMLPAGTVALVLLLSTCAAFVRFRPVHTGSAETLPNLVLITVDTLRAESCSSYGGAVRTDSIDSLAAGGTLFEQSYSLAPWTVPSMFGMFASQYPQALTPGGSLAEWRREVSTYRFTHQEPTLAERLREKGYATAAFSGNLLVSDPKGIMRGFDRVIAFDPHSPVYSGPFEMTPLLRSVLARLWPEPFLRRPVDLSRILTDHAVAFLRAKGRGPFFLWVHHIDPHEPYDPPARYREMEGRWPVFCPASPFWGSPQFDERGNVDVPLEDRAYVQHLYEAEVAYVDDCVGRLLAPLDGDSGTFVCLTSDHGEEFWEHGKFEHGHALYDELVKVPLIFEGPRIVAQRIQSPVSAIDLMPTLADLMGVEPAACWRGGSLAPVLRGEATPQPRPCFAQATNYRAWPNSFQMVDEESRKLIVEIDSGTKELFDLIQDPDEQRNVADGRMSDTEALTERLEMWRSALPVVSGADGESESEMRERLESMGYLR
ncbi:MAG: sulfatase [bacterium]|nr:sulfatase [bacterium]